MFSAGQISSFLNGVSTVLPTVKTDSAQPSSAFQLSLDEMKNALETASCTATPSNIRTCDISDGGPQRLQSRADAALSNPTFAGRMFDSVALAQRQGTVPPVFVHGKSAFVVPTHVDTLLQRGARAVQEVAESTLTPLHSLDGTVAAPRPEDYLATVFEYRGGFADEFKCGVRPEAPTALPSAYTLTPVSETELARRDAVRRIRTVAENRLRMQLRAFGEGGTL